MLKRLFIIPCFLIFFIPDAKAQEVWPGDVNNNGIANEVDLLFWGIAFGSTGPARDDIDTDWMGYPQPNPWIESFGNGVSYAFADCNGDGTVNELDVQGIEENFLLEHGIPGSDDYGNSNSGNAPRIVLQPTASAVQPGTALDINLSIDDSDMPIDSFYGIALSLSYSTEQLEVGEGPLFEMVANSWVESDNSFVQSLYIDQEGEGQAAMAITRTNQEFVPIEEGEIGTFSIVIEDIIVGLEVDTFFLQVDSVKLIIAGQGSIPVIPDTARILVTNDSTILTGKTNRIPITTNINIFPNPMNGAFHIRSESPLFDPLLFDQIGRALPLNIQSQNRKDFYLQCPPSLPSGVYWLRLRSSEGVINRKIIISR